MQAPLMWAKRLSKIEKDDFLADAQATIEAWDAGDEMVNGQIEYDLMGPYIATINDDGERLDFRAWRIAGEIHANYEEPAFTEMTDEEFTWIYS